MQLDKVTAEIRPRSHWEAVDLGFAMVRRDFWRCLVVWWLAVAVPAGLALVWLWEYPVVFVLLFWWWKPVGARMVMFELSRRLFGEQPGWREVWRQVPRAWTRRFFYRLVWARFSPWAPVSLAVEELEGLRGKAYRQRARQVVQRGEGAVMWLFFVSDFAAAWLGGAAFVLFLQLLPEGQDGAWQEAYASWDSDFPLEMPLLLLRTVGLCVVVAMSLTDVFVTGAGFGICINNRTWIEGWDVELAFKRLAQRLGTLAVVVISFFMVCETARSEEGSPAAETIREVKKDEVFKVHTVTDSVPKERTPAASKMPPLEWLGPLFHVLGICLLVVVVVLVGWLLWKYRQVFWWRGRKMLGKQQPVAARVVMGMAISPETLPVDVPTAAWALWLQGRHQECLGLLYRGAISRVVERARVEIQESDTEGDCLRRVETAGAAASPEYFRGITRVWSALAYAGVSPAGEEVQRLCREWPFQEGRGT